MAENALEKRKRLLVSADDFGWAHGVNRGIIDAHRRGIVTGASLLANGNAFLDAVELAEDTPALSLGVHLNLYRGLPVLPADRIPSLLGADGWFLGSWKEILARLVAGRVSMAEVKAEFGAAIEKVEAAGVTPVRLDSEKHLHLWPSLFDVVCELAHEHGIPRVRVVREPRSPHYIPLGLSALSRIDVRMSSARGLFFSDQTIGVTELPIDMDALRRLLASASGAAVELVAHPGYLDEEFWELQERVPNKLIHSREREAAVLSSPEAVELVEQSGYTLDGGSGAT